MEGDTREHSCVQRNVLVPCTIAIHQQEVQLFPQLPLTGIKSLVVARDRSSEGVTPLAEIDSTSVEWARSVTPSPGGLSREIRRVDLKVSQLAAGAFVTSLRATNPIPLVECCES